MNIYEKIQMVKEEFLKLGVKKSGLNKFANYNYYELSDITPNLIKLCNEYKLFTSFSFDKESATLEIVNWENPEERVVYTSPMEELELKGANRIQALGGTETYQRRYLYMAAFDIIENDMFDAVVSEVKEATDEQKETIERLVEEKGKTINQVMSVEKTTMAKLTKSHADKIIKTLEKL